MHCAIAQPNEMSSTSGAISASSGQTGSRGVELPAQKGISQLPLYERRSQMNEVRERVCGDRTSTLARSHSLPLLQRYILGNQQTNSWRWVG